MAQPSGSCMRSMSTIGRSGLSISSMTISVVSNGVTGGGMGDESGDLYLRRDSSALSSGASKIAGDKLCDQSDSLYTGRSDTLILLRDGLTHVIEWTDRIALVGLYPRDASPHAYHHRRRHNLSAPAPGAPRARAAPGDKPLLPLLALAHDRHGDAGMGGDPPQAPRQGGNHGGPAQPAAVRHLEGIVRRRRPLPQGDPEPGNGRAVRPRRARRLARAPSLHPAQRQGPRG